MREIKRVGDVKILTSYFFADSEITDTDALDSRMKLVLDGLICSSFWKDVMRDKKFQPIVVATTVDDEMKCAISFGYDHFVAVSILLKKYIAALPISECIEWNNQTIDHKLFCLFFLVIDFVKYFKRWQTIIYANKRFNFSSYQITLLVIWFFQYKNCLPSVKQQESVDEKLFHEGEVWFTIFTFTN